MSVDILVYAHWAALLEPTLVGALSADTVRSREQFRFAYDEDWLSSDHAQQLDPELELYSGEQFAGDAGNFRVFLDSCPDRWGKLIMQRREAARAHAEGRKPRLLMPSDHLLGVHDFHRMGALRFKTEPEGPFLDDAEEMMAPPMARLRELEHAAQRLEEDGDLEDPEYLSWLNLLISPGSSLGGARPKASVIDKQGALWIAKFPSRLDDHDVGLWEQLVAELAASAGVVMAPSSVDQFSSEHHTFLTRRFDREGDRRLHFSSAMTQLGHDDGETAASYLEIAEFLTNHGSNTAEDLAELWRRIVFNIAVSNTDDHLRNHGFLFDRDGWRLSPAYDINPEPTGTGLHLFISDKDNRLDYELAFSVIEFFQLGEQQARQIHEQVVEAVAGWETLAQTLGIPRVQRQTIEPAFNVP